ncbi:response regulator [Desulfococcaceae bacterium HSG9]|nr:response regulator [Desulfococcaceae bacterium HSG9]
MNEPISDASILIVDDSIDNLRVLSNILKEQGYKTRSLRKAEAVFSSVMQFPPDIILLDIIMSGLDGYEVCGQLKADERTRDIPVIFISALHEIDEKVRAFSTGGVDYITKPFQEEEVLIRVETHLALRKAQQLLETQNRQLKQEIAERKRAEDALRQNQALLNATGQMAKVGGWELDAETLDVTWTEQTYRIHEIPLEHKPLLQEAIDFFHPDDRDRLSQAIQRALEYGEPYDMEIRFITATGKHLQTRTVCSPQVVDGKTSKLIGTFQDITELKQVEDALRESEEKFRMLFDNAPVLINAFDENGRCLLWNKECEKVLGWTIEELSSHDNPLALFYPDPKIQQEVLNTVSSKAERVFREWRPLTKNGEERIVLWANFQLPNGMVINIGYDDTMRKRAEKELKKTKQAAEAANQAKSVFLSNMSHELRTPLNAIMGYAQILQRSQEVDADHLHRLRIIHSSGEHLLTLINDILDISKIEAGKMALLPADIHIVSFLNGVAAIIRARAEEKALDFTVETDALPEGLRADEFRLRQILLNLLSNAVKFTEKGCVTLSVSAISGQEDKRRAIRFEVTDTGVGISPDDLDRVFRPFEQAGGILGRADGTGLGLSITQNLVNMMGGKLKAESSPEQGSTFWFELSMPIAAIKTEELLHDREIIGYTGAQRKILIADDMPESRMVLLNMLESVGFEPVLAENGQVAVAKSRDIRPNLILMDLQMPVMNGYEAMRAIRREAALRDVPIIAVSATVLESNRRKCREAGCDAFLPKPVHAKELYALLETHLNLTWTYAEPAEGTIPENAKQEPLIPPPPNELAVLHKMALFGDMSQIEERAAHIISSDKRYRPFGEKLKRLAKRFEEKKIQSLVENFIQKGDEI